MNDARPRRTTTTWALVNNRATPHHATILQVQRNNRGERRDRRKQRSKAKRGICDKNDKYRKVKALLVRRSGTHGGHNESLKGDRNGIERLRIASNCSWKLGRNSSTAQPFHYLRRAAAALCGWLLVLVQIQALGNETKKGKI